jgi:Ca2+-binding RTX toxin-like protein
VQALCIDRLMKPGILLLSSLWLSIVACGPGTPPQIILSGCPESFTAGGSFQLTVAAADGSAVQYHTQASDPLVIVDGTTARPLVIVPESAAGPHEVSIEISFDGAPAGSAECRFQVCRPATCAADADCDDGRPCSVEICVDLGCAGGTVCRSTVPIDCCSGDEDCRIIDPCAVCRQGQCDLGDVSNCDDDCACADPQDPETVSASGRVLTRSADDICGGGEDDAISAALRFSPDLDAQVGTLQSDDCVDGLDGQDVLSAVFAARIETVIRPQRLLRVEELRITDIGDARTVVDASNAAGLRHVVSVSSTQIASITGLAEIVDLSLVRTGAGAVLGFAPRAGAEFASVLAVTLEETQGGTLAVDPGTGRSFERFEVTSSGDAPAALARLTQEAEARGEISFFGAQPVEIRRFDAGMVTFDASAMAPGGVTLGGGDGSVESPFIGLHARTGNGAVESIIGSPGADRIVFGESFDELDGAGGAAFIHAGGGDDALQAELSGSQSLSAPSLEILHLSAAADASLDLAGVPDVKEVWIHGAPDRTARTLQLIDLQAQELAAVRFRGDGQALDQIYDAVTVQLQPRMGQVEGLTVIIDNREVPLHADAVPHRHLLAGLIVGRVEHLDVVVLDGPAIIEGGLRAERLKTVTFTSDGHLNAHAIGTGSGTRLEVIDAGGVGGGFSAAIADLASGATISGGPGDDLLTVHDGPSGGASVALGTGNDAFASADANSADNVDAGPGNDVVDAGPGNDVVDGGDGSDVVTGGPGHDQLTGGGGSDTFVLAGITSHEHADSLIDFESGLGGDVLRLDAASFGDYAVGAAVRFAPGAAASSALTSAVDNVIIRGTKAAVLQTTPSGGGQAVIGIATDTGEIYRAVAGDFGSAEVIATIPASAAASLTAENFAIVP